MCKTKNPSVQINEASKTPILLQLLVKIDQNSRVYQLSVINQTRIGWMLENSWYGWPLPEV